jgi:uncharacterized membrane protein YdfJ with MMPL/SSD domain
MAGMLFAGSKIFTSIGIGTIIVVFTSLVGSLIVLPALLGTIGDRVERGIRQVLAAALLRALRPLNLQPRVVVWLRDTPTLLRELKGERPESRAWAFALRWSMRFPALAVGSWQAYCSRLRCPCSPFTQSCRASPICPRASTS